MRVLAVTGRLLRSNLKSPQQLIIMMLFPIFFTLVFGGLISAQNEALKYKIAVSISDENGPAENLKTLLTDNPRLEIFSVSEDDARKLVKERKVLAAVIVPEDFANKLMQESVFNYSLVREEENNLYIAARQEIDQAFLQLHTAAVTANLAYATRSDPRWQELFNSTLEAWETHNIPLTVTDLTHSTSEVPVKSRTNFGFVIMFVMMSLVTSTGIMLQERADGTWQRLLASPIRHIQVLAGYLLGHFILGWVQFAILVGVSSTLFNVYWGDPLGLVLIISVFILCSISLALALGGFVKTFQQQQAISTIFITATSMLAGVFWPLEMEPAAMQIIAKAIPQYWAVIGVKTLLLSGLDWARLALPIGVLAAFAVVFFFIGVVRMKFE